MPCPRVYKTEYVVIAGILQTARPTMRRPHATDTFLRFPHFLWFHLSTSVSTIS